jgi:xanthine dehydrogenase large subunit
MNNLNKIPIHDSSLRHSTGQAVYIDDMPEQENLLHCSTFFIKNCMWKNNKY